MHKRDNRKAALAQIHIAKKQLGLDEDTYRQMLKNLTGKSSCSDMVIGELYQVIRHLENVGFKKHRPRRNQYSPRSTGKIIDVMRAVWIQMHQAGIVRDGSEIALTHWAKRASSQRNGGVGVESLEWLERDTRLASQVLEDLKQWRKRALKQQEAQHGN
ncbi:MAG: gp16 family protein [Nitrincola lacisaponensis]|uniref:gp16 family protein n=1 Tax=Nitrincola lacisaponensis TaxID=267850 RepID=UPI00391A1E5C